MFWKKKKSVERKMKAQGLGFVEHSNIATAKVGRFWQTGKYYCFFFVLCH
jgi:hypothetical protein